ncbi:SWIM zinc finger [Natronoarchaeum philippinense]|uniref:SWIM zinc finger n=1 Tax=Natronoarchaeum philippinense TaxID=558529 RepID=A0A285P1M8_NATPI|nr:SWIM zinc finger family protein [Natronoarchaeum philippinense]SNZ15642.1 SWIM zinc finger [Natronoarchaeum philippinense]
MTQTEHTPASDRRRRGISRGKSGVDERTRRAFTERMRVTAIGGGTYEVDSQSGHSYLVDLEGGRCTCPDHVYRGERCKHLRRVAIDVSEGRVPPPGKMAVDCAVCGVELFVDEGAHAPHLCGDHEFGVGDLVYDRETGNRVLVVGTPERRADDISIRRGHSVADHYSNADYPEDDAVVAAVYPQSLQFTADGPVPPSLTVYTFPRSRLSPSPPERSAATAAP